MPYPDDKPQPLDMSEFFAVLRRRKWFVILPVLLVVGAALGLVAARTPVYSSTASVEVLPKTTGLIPNMDNESARVTFAQVQSRAAAILAAAGEPTSLATDADVSVSVPANTEILDITCTAPEATSAQACAQAFAEAYVADRKEVVDRDAADDRRPFLNDIATANAKIVALEGDRAATTDPVEQARIDGDLSDLRVKLGSAQTAMNLLPRPPSHPAEIVTPADLPTQPSNKDYVTTGILAAILGLALGVGLAFIRQRMDARVGEHDGLDAALGAPLLAVVPHLSGRRRKGSTVVALEDPDGIAAEAYRSARPVLLHRAREHDVKTILVTGPGQGEGKSSTTANLGVVLARSGYRVALVSCDLRKPALHRFFKLPSEPGLADVLRQRLPLHRALLKTGVANLLLLPSGVPSANPSELLGSGAMAAVVAALRAHADFVLLDTPPSLVVADALELAPIADGIVVVVDGSRTTQSDVGHLRVQLDQVGGRLLGCVLNNLDPKAASRYGSYSNAEYRYTAPRPKGRSKEDRGLDDWSNPDITPRRASEVNVALGPAPIDAFGASTRTNGNGRPHVPEPPQGVVSGPASPPLPDPAPPSDEGMWH